MIVYLDMRTGHEEHGDAYGYHGRKLGTWQQVSTWPTAHNVYQMHAIQLATDDGAEWSGSAKIAHPYRVRVHRKTGVDNQT